MATLTTQEREWLEKFKETEDLDDAPESIKSSKNFILEVVKIDGYALDSASEELQSDKEVVLTAVQNAGYALKYASEELQSDKEVILEAIRNDGEALEFASDELKANKEIVLLAVQNYGSALQFASYELQDDKEIVLAAVKNAGYALEFASAFLRADDEVISIAVEQDEDAREYAFECDESDDDFALTSESDEILKNKILEEEDLEELIEIFKSIYLMETNGTIHEDKAIDIYDHSFKYIYRELDGKKACLDYCNGCPIEDFGKNELIEIMYKASNRKKEIIEAIQTIMNTSIYAGKYMDYFETIKESGLTIKNVETIEDILDILEEDASQLKNYPQYQDNKQVLLTAIESCGKCFENPLQYASDKLKNDKEFILEVMEVNGNALRYASEELQNDKEVVLAAVQNDGFALEYASEDLRDDKEVVLAAVQNDGRALEYASEELRDDKEVALAAVQETGYAFYHTSERLQADKEIVIEAIFEDNIDIIETINDDLKNDKDVLRAIVAFGKDDCYNDLEEFKLDCDYAIKYLDEEKFEKAWNEFDDYNNEVYK